MSKSLLSILLGVIAGTLAACEGGWMSGATSSSSLATPIAATSIHPVTSPDQSANSSANPSGNSSANPSASSDFELYHQAVARASRAFALSQSAQSRDDWRLVAERWRQAVDGMNAVPTRSPHRAQAQQKLTEYRRNLAYAQQQANRSTAVANPNGVIVLSQPTAAPVIPSQPAPQPNPSFARSEASNAGQPRVFSVPIVRRAGNTPVVNVTFNGNRTFQMIVDTGASGTLITRAMANSLRVVPVAQASVDTASERNVTVPLGYVHSINVGGAVAQEVLVAVAGPELSIGLLGHDFFGNYDVTIRESAVEFRERS